MHPRYQHSEIGRFFTDEAMWAEALAVELAAQRALVEIGKMPREDLQAILDRVPVIDEDLVRAIDERERITRHDVGAFVAVVSERINHPAAATWFHYGLTSADITDTALCRRLVRATDVLVEVAEKLLGTLCSRAREFATTPTAGRTHGQHAEIITFGVRLANWAEMVQRAIETLSEAGEQIAVGKLSGSVGTYANIDPRIEELACKELGLRPITATQVVPRDLHAKLVFACVCLGNAIADMSFNLRIMGITEIGEAAEGFSPGQQGSSSMPNKKNPVKCEQLDGLERNLLGYLVTACQNVGLLMERDISHSAPERIELADALELTYHMTVTMERVLANLVVDTARMQANINSTIGVMYTQTVLMVLLDRGWQRQEAYAFLQKLAFRAKDEDRQFRDLLSDSSEVDFTAAELDTMFSQERMLRHCGGIVDRLPV